MSKTDFNELLGIPHLSPVDKVGFPLYGRYHRPTKQILFKIPVSNGIDKMLCVHFVLDIARRETCLSRETIEALKLTESYHVLMNGIPITIEPNESKDILGTKYMDKLGARLSIDFYNGIAVLTRQSPV